MSDKWCTTCGFLIEMCRCSRLDRCGDCNGLIVEGFCDCDDVREDEDEEDYCDCPSCRDEEDEDEIDCDCDCCLDICVDSDCGNCMS